MVNKMTVISEAEARVHSQGALHVKFVRDNFFLQVLRLSTLIFHSIVASNLFIHRRRNGKWTR